MSAGPRIVFLRFATASSPKLTPWVGHSELVIGVAAEVPLGPPTGTVVWQLVSANNRQLARGAEVHDTFEQARANAARVVERHADLEVDLVSEGRRGVYGWLARLDGEPVITCSRWYVNDRDRRHSIELARRSLAIAVLHSGARLNDPALMAGDRGYAL